MKRVIFAILLVVITLPAMSFTETPTNVPYKMGRNLPVQVTYEYGINYFPPGGGICMADRTTTWYYIPMHGWFIQSQTYSNVYCYYP